MNPIKVSGNWTEGYTLDKHTLYSIPLGENEYGHMTFDTKRTELGELLYKMKYNGNTDTSAEILRLISPFLDDWLQNKNIDFIIPTPPTKKRKLQPVFAVTLAIARHYGLNYDLSVFKKISDLQAKNMSEDSKSLNGCIEMAKHSTRPHNVLLIDDLYQTGSTAKECVRLLLQDENINNVYYLALTRSKA